MIPYENNERRIRDLEARCTALEMLVRTMEARLATSGMPIFARLWLCTLNEDMGSTTSGQASADLLGLDGTDTNRDVTVIDTHDIFTDLANGAKAVCIEQLDIDGARFYTLIQAECPVA